MNMLGVNVEWDQQGIIDSLLFKEKIMKLAGNFGIIVRQTKNMESKHQKNIVIDRPPFLKSVINQSI